MNNRLPGDIAAADDDAGPAAPPADIRPGRRLIAVMLLAAAALDLTRCGLVLATARHPAPAAGLVVSGLAAAALSMRTARGCQGGQRWAGWAALLIGVASAPQAAASGFHAPYTIPDTATAALGVLLTVAVLATAGLTGLPGDNSGNPCPIDLRGYPASRGSIAPAHARGAPAPATDAGPVSSRTFSAGSAGPVAGARTAQSASISRLRPTGTGPVTSVHSVGSTRASRPAGQQPRCSAASAVLGVGMVRELAACSIRDSR